MRILKIFITGTSRVLLAGGLLLLAVGTALANGQDGRVAQAASAMGREMDRQLAARLGQESPVSGVSLASTTPVDLSNLEVSNALALQMQEELMRWFVSAGYSAQEIRKGKDILVRPEHGELLLTRKEDLLAKKTVTSNLVLAGTYSLTPQAVRFNMRFIDTATEEIYAMSSVTLLLGPELRSLLAPIGPGAQGGGNSGGNGYACVTCGYNYEPSVFTSLP